MKITTWSKKEEHFLRGLNTPHKVQNFLDRIPYRTADEYPPPIAVIRDGLAHCFDGALFAATALSRSGWKVGLVNLRAAKDDDHLLCVYRVGNFFGAVAKSNFPGLRYREPIFRSLRELVLSYFEFYFNLKGEKSLRAYSRMIKLPKPNKLAWETDQISVDKLADIISETPHKKLLSKAQQNALSKLDQRLYRSQLLGVKLKGVKSYSE